MKLLLTGAQGQLGQALRMTVPQGIDLLPTSRHGDADQGILALDLADPQACVDAVETLRPDWILNAGAFTSVDRAESESSLAEAVNTEAPRALAQALEALGGQRRFLQISTDFVFGGEQGSPYSPDQCREPLGVYGKTKAAGEQAVADVLGVGVEGRAAILRTSWVYGPVGRNFLLTMLRLHRKQALEAAPIRVVADQIGCPTATTGLARACWAVVQRSIVGIHHWSDEGVASWYDFAVAIGELAISQGLLTQAAEVLPIKTVDYPTPAQRPAYSLLDCSASRQALACSAQHWRCALEEVLRALEI